MSLINEALKKAQRSRHEGAAGTGSPGTPPAVEKRAQPRSAKSMLLIATGAVVLVVVSMVLTTLYLTRPTKPAATVPTPAKVAAAAPATATPSVVVPVIATPAPAAASQPVPVPIAPASATVPKPTALPSAEPKNTPVPTSAPVSTSPAPTAPPVSSAAVASKAETPAPAAPPAKPDERVHAFVEAVRVTGIRSSGSDSKVLMNDRVYRVNDIVDRALGVRLTQVSPDSLTFTDANGVTYVKYF